MKNLLKQKNKRRDNSTEIKLFFHRCCFQEVIVYPDDGNKPALGDGLNKKAQITLDKVWPEDKANSSVIRSPDRLRSMSYEDKLIREQNRKQIIFNISHPSPLLIGKP